MDTSTYLNKDQVNDIYIEKKKALKDKLKQEKKEYKEGVQELKEERKYSLKHLPYIKDKKVRKEFERQVLIERRKKLGLPSYTKGEELMNAISHIVGGAICLAFLIVGVYYAAILNKGPMFIIPMIIYGIAMVFLYTMSALYHFLNVNRAKKVFQYLDHCTIFVLITGTYVPVCSFILTNIYPYNYVILAVVIALSALGISLNATMMDKLPVKIISNTLYLVIGWLVIFFYQYLLDSMGLTNVLMFILGGVAYSIGAILYGIGSKKKYFHFIFHLFCILGTVLQFLPILLFIIQY